MGTLRGDSWYKPNIQFVLGNPVSVSWQLTASDLEVDDDEIVDDIELINDVRETLRDCGWKVELSQLKHDNNLISAEIVTCEKIAKGR